MKKLIAIIFVSLCLVFNPQLSESKELSDGEFLISLWALNSICKLGMKDDTEASIVEAIEDLSTRYKWTTEEKHQKIIEFADLYRPQKKQVCSKKGSNVKIYNQAIKYIETNGVNKFLDGTKGD